LGELCDIHKSVVMSLPWRSPWCLVFSDSNVMVVQIWV